MSPPRQLPRLLLLTDRSQLPLGRSLLATLRECVDAGATAVVVRELDLPDPQRAALASSLAELGATVIAAHRPLAGAVGVHLPAAGAPSAASPQSCNAELPGLPTRPDGGEDLITPRYSWVGRSCHSVEEVRRAAVEGAAYATLSPYAASASKPGYGPALRSEKFAGHAIPVYALAGVTPHNARAARHAGAHGVAVMGAVMRAAHPGRMVERLLAEVDR